jgi:hypothetical protein
MPSLLGGSTSKLRMKFFYAFVPIMFLIYFHMFPIMFLKFLMFLRNFLIWELFEAKDLVDQRKKN